MMDGVDLIERLEGSNVIMIDNLDGTVRISQSYKDEKEKVYSMYRSFQQNEISEHIESNCDASVSGTLINLYDRNPNFVIDYLTLNECLNNLSVDETIRSIVTLNYLKNGKPSVDGTPTGFLPIQGDLTVPLVSFAENAILYVWRSDCEPCEIVKKDFESMFEEGLLNGLLLLAVFGPEDAKLLQDHFDVVGGPSTLFISDGAVNSRLIGAPPRESLENEVQILQENSSSR